MVCSFSCEIAEEYGLYEAILLESLHYWIKKNAVNNKNWHDGLYWTYNSAKAFTEFFPYMSNATIRRALGNLEDQGLIITGNYNKAAYDRTKWYALTEKGLALFGEKPEENPEKSSFDDEENPDTDLSSSICSNQQIHDTDLSKSICSTICSNQQINLLKSENRIDDLSKPIPNIIPNIIPNKKRNTKEKNVAKKNVYTTEFEDFWKIYPRKAEKAEAYKCYQARLNDGYSPEELKEAAEKYAEQCRRNHTEIRYTKQAKTFLGPNTPFTDFLPTMMAEEEKPKPPNPEEDDEVMEQFRKLMGITT